MAVQPSVRTTDPVEEAQLLEAIDKWLDRDVRPDVAKF